MEKEIKEKILHNIVKEANSKRKGMMKMRFCSVSSVYKQKEYLSKLTVNEIKWMIKVKLHMLSVKTNCKNKYQGKFMFPLCEEEADTTEAMEMRERRGLLKELKK